MYLPSCMLALNFIRTELDKYSITLVEYYRNSRCYWRSANVIPRLGTTAIVISRKSHFRYSWKLRNKVALRVSAVWERGSDHFLDSKRGSSSRTDCIDDGIPVSFPWFIEVSELLISCYCHPIPSLLSQLWK